MSVSSSSSSFSLAAAAAPPSSSVGRKEEQLATTTMTATTTKQKKKPKKKKPTTTTTTTTTKKDDVDDDDDKKPRRNHIGSSTILGGWANRSMPDLILRHQVNKSEVRHFQTSGWKEHNDAIQRNSQSRSRSRSRSRGRNRDRNQSQSRSGEQEASRNHSLPPIRLQRKGNSNNDNNDYHHHHHHNQNNIVETNINRWGNSMNDLRNTNVDTPPSFRGNRSPSAARRRLTDTNDNDDDDDNDDNTKTNNKTSTRRGGSMGRGKKSKKEKKETMSQSDHVIGSSTSSLQLYDNHQGDTNTVTSNSSSQHHHQRIRSKSKGKSRNDKKKKKKMSNDSNLIGSNSHHPRISQREQETIDAILSMHKEAEDNNNNNKNNQQRLLSANKVATPPPTTTTTLSSSIHGGGKGGEANAMSVDSLIQSIRKERNNNKNNNRQEEDEETVKKSKKKHKEKSNHSRKVSTSKRASSKVRQQGMPQSHKTSSSGGSGSQKSNVSSINQTDVIKKQQQTKKIHDSSSFHNNDEDDHGNANNGKISGAAVASIEVNPLDVSVSTLGSSMSMNQRTNQYHQQQHEHEHQYQYPPYLTSQTEVETESAQTEPNRHPRRIQEQNNSPTVGRQQPRKKSIPMRHDQAFVSNTDPNTVFGNFQNVRKYDGSSYNNNNSSGGGGDGHFGTMALKNVDSKVNTRKTTEIDKRPRRGSTGALADHGVMSTSSSSLIKGGSKVKDESRKEQRFSVSAPTTPTTIGRKVIENHSSTQNAQGNVDDPYDLFLLSGEECTFEEWTEKRQQQAGISTDGSLIATRPTDTGVLSSHKASDTLKTTTNSPPPVFTRAKRRGSTGALVQQWEHFSNHQRTVNISPDSQSKPHYQSSGDERVTKAAKSNSSNDITTNADDMYDLFMLSGATCDFQTWCEQQEINRKVDTVDGGTTVLKSDEPSKSSNKPMKRRGSTGALAQRWEKELLPNLVKSPKQQSTHSKPKGKASFSLSERVHSMGALVDQWEKSELIVSPRKHRTKKNMDESRSTTTYDKRSGRNTSKFRHAAAMPLNDTGPKLVIRMPKRRGSTGLQNTIKEIEDKETGNSKRSQQLKALLSPTLPLKKKLSGKSPKKKIKKTKKKQKSTHSEQSAGEASIEDGSSPKSIQGQSTHSNLKKKKSKSPKSSKKELLHSDSEKHNSYTSKSKTSSKKK